MLNGGYIIIIVLLFITYVCGCIQGHKDIHGDTPCIEGVHNLTLPTKKSFPHYGHHSYNYHHHHHHRCHHYHRIVRLLWTREHSFSQCQFQNEKISNTYEVVRLFTYINGNMGYLKLKRYTEL